MLAPTIDITEYPVNGNANGSVGIYVVNYGICKSLESNDGLKFYIMQREAIKREGNLLVGVEIKNKKQH